MATALPVVPLLQRITRLAILSPSRTKACSRLRGLSSGPLAVAFTLPDDHPATLKVLDVSGRRVAVRDVGSLGAGRHVLWLAEPATLHPGIYLVRLVRGERAVALPVCVVR